MVPIPPAPQPLTHVGAPTPGKPYSLPLGTSFRNNQQLTVSGFKNEHGDEDNRFVDLLYIDLIPNRKKRDLGLLFTLIYILFILNLYPLVGYLPDIM